MAIRRRYIRRLVDELLARTGVTGAPVPVVGIAKALGVQVRPQWAEPDLSGFLLRDAGGTRAIIGVNSQHHRNRRRFTVAHELGHFLLHGGERLHVDRSSRGYLVMHRDERSSEGTDEHEIEANIFAAELLMPAAFLERDLEQLDPADLLDEDGLISLAAAYRVSPQALTFRLANLGYIRM